VVAAEGLEIELGSNMPSPLWPRRCSRGRQTDLALALRPCPLLAAALMVAVEYGNWRVCGGAADRSAGPS
jgi:hypothetical protein